MERSYPVTLAIALAALVPFIIITTAYELYRSQVIGEVGGVAMDYEIILYVATAGYAFGAFVGGYLIQRYPQRSLYFACEALFVAGSILAAVAQTKTEYGSGVVLEGLATGFLLVVALPPVIQRFPAEKLPLTATFIDLGFFAAIALGPLVGGFVAEWGGWRWLYAGFAAIGAIALAVAAFTLPSKPATNPNVAFDRSGIVLGFLGTVLPFWAVGALTMHGFSSPWFLAPFLVGCACFAAMLLVEFHAKEPISPIKAMWNTLPVVGVIVAMIGGGAFFTFFVLTQQYSAATQHLLALKNGLAFWPAIPGVLISATAFGPIVKTRFLPLFALAGMLCLVAAGALLFGIHALSVGTTQQIAYGLLGLGAGATVAPGLWLASLSLASKMVGRIFALVELVRSEANFLMAPIVLKIAENVSGGTGTISTSGLHAGLWITLAITLVLTIVAVALYLAGAPGLQRPNLRRWLNEDKPAWESPELLAPLRGVHPHQQQAHRKAS